MRLIIQQPAIKIETCKVLRKATSGPVIRKHSVRQHNGSDCITVCRQVVQTQASTGLIGYKVLLQENALARRLRRDDY